MFVGVKKSGRMMKTKKRKTRGLSFLSDTIIDITDLLHSTPKTPKQ